MAVTGRVLVVSRNVALSLGLERMGFDVEELRTMFGWTGADGLPSAVLLDLRDPDHATDAIDHVRAVSPHVPVVVLGSSSNQWRALGERDGVKVVRAALPPDVLAAMLSDVAIAPPPVEVKRQAATEPRRARAPRSSPGRGRASPRKGSSEAVGPASSSTLGDVPRGDVAATVAPTEPAIADNGPDGNGSADSAPAATQPEVALEPDTDVTGEDRDGGADGHGVDERAAHRPDPFAAHTAPPVWDLTDDDAAPSRRDRSSPRGWRPLAHRRRPRSRQAPDSGEAFPAAQSTQDESQAPPDIGIAKARDEEDAGWLLDAVSAPTEPPHGSDDAADAIALGVGEAPTPAASRGNGVRSKRHRRPAAEPVEAAEAPPDAAAPVTADPAQLDVVAGVAVESGVADDTQLGADRRPPTSAELVEVEPREEVVPEPAVDEAAPVAAAPPPADVVVDDAVELEVADAEAAKPGGWRSRLRRTAPSGEPSEAVLPWPGHPHDAVPNDLELVEVEPREEVVPEPAIDVAALVAVAPPPADVVVDDVVELEVADAQATRPGGWRSRLRRTAPSGEPSGAVLPWPGHPHDAVPNDLELVEVEPREEVTPEPAVDVAAPVAGDTPPADVVADDVVEVADAEAAEPGGWRSRLRRTPPSGEPSDPVLPWPGHPHDRAAVPTPVMDLDVAPPDAPPEVPPGPTQPAPLVVLPFSSTSFGRHLTVNRRVNGAAVAMPVRDQDPPAAAPAPTVVDLTAAHTESPAELVRELLEDKEELYGLHEVATAVLEEAMSLCDAQAGAFLALDGALWQVIAGVALRPIEERLVMTADHWVVTSTINRGLAVLVEDSDIVRQRVAGMPLASWQHLLASPVGRARGLLILARTYEAFSPDDIAKIASVDAEATPLLDEALRLRELARALQDFS